MLTIEVESDQRELSLNSNGRYQFDLSRYASSINFRCQGLDRARRVSGECKQPLIDHYVNLKSVFTFVKLF